MKQLRHPRFRALIIILALGVFASACGSDALVVDTGSPTPTVANTDGPTTTDGPSIDSTDPMERLEAARVLWAASGPSSYALTTQLQCFCPLIEWKNVVVDGEVVSTESIGEDQFIEPEAQTMETLFDEVEEAIQNGYFRLDLEFDSTTGALSNYWVDVEEMMADEEHGVIVTVSAIGEVAAETPDEPNSTPLTLTAEAIAGLTVDHGCGFGFAKGNGDETVALIIYFRGEYTEAGPDLSSAIEFPSDDWVAEVHTGSDLFSNWCDDAIEEDDPVPVVASVWTVVGGTLTTTADAPNEVGGLLSDLVIEAPSGEQVEIDEIAVFNGSYGFFAG